MRWSTPRSRGSAPAGRSRSSRWVHLYDAHAPYEPPAPFDARFTASPYDGEIAYVDACIGRLIAALERSGRLDRTLVAVVADHGESLGDHGEQEHGMFLYEGVLRIPWILRLPGRAHAGRTVAEQVRAIDVLPTVAALAGVAAPRGDGESVAAVIEGQAAPRAAALLRRDLVPEVALRLERADVDPRRGTEVHRRAEAGAVRPPDRCRGSAESRRLARRAGQRHGRRS